MSFTLSDKFNIDMQNFALLTHHRIQAWQFFAVVIWMAMSVIK